MCVAIVNPLLHLHLHLHLYLFTFAPTFTNYTSACTFTLNCAYTSARAFTQTSLKG